MVVMRPAHAVLALALAVGSFAAAIAVGWWLSTLAPGLWLIYLLAWTWAVGWLLLAATEHAGPEPRHPIRTARHR